MSRSIFRMQNETIAHPFSTWGLSQPTGIFPARAFGLSLKLKMNLSISRADTDLIGPLDRPMCESTCMYAKHSLIKIWLVSQPIQAFRVPYRIEKILRQMGFRPNARPARFAVDDVDNPM